MSHVHGNPTKQLRNAMLCVLFKDGLVIQEVADTFHITRQRAQQILGQQGVSAVDGGVSVRSQRRRAAAEERSIRQQRERYYGLTQSEFKRQMNKGRPLNAKASFFRAYSRCKANALYRGTPWTITFQHWVEAWNEAGGWREASDRSREPVFGRVDKELGYVPGNVHVIDRKSLMLGRRGPFAIHW